MEKKVNLLEIGLQTITQFKSEGTDIPSLRIWKEYFHSGNIHGVDLNDFKALASSDFHIRKLDQGSRADLKEYTDGIDYKFDLIIDDGSHLSSDQQVSLGVLFTKLNSGGFI